MNAIDYQKQMAIKMITKFKKEFEEKTDLRIKISVNKYKIYANSDEPSEPITYIGLQDLENDFIDCLPNRLKNIDILRIDCRKREFVDFRSIFAHIAVKFNFTFVSIGQHIDRHHSTIISLRNKANNLLETDPMFFNLYTEILTKIEKKYV
jgi:hypothetical protein